MRTSVFRMPLSWLLGMVLLPLSAAAQSTGPTKAQAPPKQSTQASKKTSSAESTRSALGDSLSEEAKAEYEAAKVLYVDGDYAGASLKFQNAYDLSKDARLLWNVIVCQKNLRHYARVLSLVRRYQAEEGESMSEQDRRDAEDLVRAVRAFVSPLLLTVNEPGATVYVDGEPIGVSPMSQPVLVDIGVRQIKVTKRGFRDAVRELRVSGTVDVRLTVKLEREDTRGRLLVEAGAVDNIAVDGKLVGVGRWEGPIARGRHAVRITSEGKLPYEGEVIVRAKETRELRMSLQANQQEGGSIWWWIAGGATVLTGAAIGGYFLWRPEEKQPPPTIIGTMAPGTVQLPLTAPSRP
ncbi:MAG: PEGA domain-containing protein [Polyangiaceae bacterium]|nr:PEGA domain-containing protein [Polyangiaceae bacterium]